MFHLSADPAFLTQVPDLDGGDCSEHILFGSNVDLSAHSENEQPAASNNRPAEQPTLQDEATKQQIHAPPTPEKGMAEQKPTSLNGSEKQQESGNGATGQADPLETEDGGAKNSEFEREWSKTSSKEESLPEEKILSEELVKKDEIDGQGQTAKL